ncbi:MAG: hypothetical protein M0Z28_32205 [Rhodospirillales bacterium]|nr:hypothetical protein [Rhodospirillales bacterium]
MTRTMTRRVAALEAGQPDDIARMTDDELRAACQANARVLLADPDCPMPPDVRAIMEREAAGEMPTMDESSQIIGWLEALL